jgi:hypothetical protein
MMANDDGPQRAADRRHHRRVLVERKAAIESSDGNVPATLHDLSMGGACVIERLKVIGSGQGHEPGALVRIVLPGLGGAAGLRLGARVVHQQIRSRGTGAIRQVGLEFLPLSAEEHVLLEILVASFRPRAG